MIIGASSRRDSESKPVKTNDRRGPRTPDRRICRDDCDDPPNFQKNVCDDLSTKKRVFWGENGQDPEPNKNLESRIKMPRGTLKNTIQCKNPPTEISNFGGARQLRALHAQLLVRARGRDSLKQQFCTRLPFIFIGVVA